MIRLSPHAWLGGLVALSLSGLAVMFAPESALPPFNPFDARISYAPGGDRLQAIVAPVLHAPWDGTRPLVLAWLAGFTITIVAVATARACGATRAAAMMVAAALLLSAPFAASVRHGADVVVSVLLVWFSWWMLIGSQDRAARWLAGGITAWVGAVTFSWVAIVTLPVIALAVVARPSSPRTRGLVLAASVPLATAGVLAYLTRSASRARSQVIGVDTAVTWFDVASVAWGSTARADSRFAAPDVSSLAGLWVALTVAALLFARWPRWWRAGLLSAAACAVACWFEWPAWRSDLVRWVGWTTAPLAAAGLTWAASNVTTPWRGLATCLLGATLVGASVSASARPLGGHAPREFRNRFAEAVRPLIARGGGVVFVSEDGLVDSALAAWAVAPRLIQDADALIQVEGQHRRALAGPAGRSHLELFGIEFITIAAIQDPLPYRLSQVAARLHCATVRADRWSLLPGLEFTGRLGIHVPSAPSGHLVVIAGAEAPLRLRATLMNGSALPLVQETLLSGPGVRAPPPDYWLDGGDPRLAPSHIVRVRIPAQPSDVVVLNLELGRRAPRVLARLEGYDEAARGRVCAAPLGPDAFWHTDGSGSIQVPLGVPALFGSGWHGVEGARDRLFRWTEGDAAVLIPSAREGPVRVALDAAAAAEPFDGGPVVTLHVNGLAEAARVMPAGVSRYEWVVSRGRWVVGTNELRFSVSRSVRPADRGDHDTRVLGMRVHGLTLERE
jgi:hypothetical protein